MVETAARMGVLSTFYLRHAYGRDSPGLHEEDGVLSANGGVLCAGCGEEAPGLGARDGKGGGGGRGGVDEERGGVAGERGRKRGRDPIEEEAVGVEGGEAGGVFGEIGDRGGRGEGGGPSGGAGGARGGRDEPGDANSERRMIIEKRHGDCPSSDGRCGPVVCAAGDACVVLIFAYSTATSCYV